MIFLLFLISFSITRKTITMILNFLLATEVQLLKMQCGFVHREVQYVQSTTCGNSKKCRDWNQSLYTHSSALLIFSLYQLRRNVENTSQIEKALRHLSPLYVLHMIAHKPYSNE